MKKLFVVIGSFFLWLGIWLKLIDKPIPAVKIIVNGTLVKVLPASPTGRIPYMPLPSPSTISICSASIPPPWYANLWPIAIAIGLIMLIIAILNEEKRKRVIDSIIDLLWKLVD